MEVILELFFENFSQLERNALHARYKRRAMAEYLSTLIEGCRRGEECDPQKTCRDAIVGVLRYHEKSAQSNGSVCMMGKCHNVLYVAIKLCYDWQLKDSATVVAVLDQIYECEKTFERIWVGALFGTRAPYHIAGWKSDFEDQEDNLRAVVYFMHHAANAGAEYPGENEETMRFVDVPIESCGKITPLKIVAQLGLPDKLHILLRFGAVCDEATVESLLDKLNVTGRKYPYNLVDCLQFILRSVPCICLERVEEEEDSKIERELVFGRYSQLIEDCILPIRRCGLEPPELKHLCRCCIRRKLWENHQLPNGIRMLPVPEPLHKYLDLLMD